jgi:hypothetical protein
MSACWTNFAKYGVPNGPGVPSWPAFSDQHPVVMYFGGTAHTGPVPSELSLRVLDGYFAWRRDPEGEQVKAPQPRPQADRAGDTDPRLTPATARTKRNTTSRAVAQPADAQAKNRPEKLILRSRIIEEKFAFLIKTHRGCRCIIGS